MKHTQVYIFGCNARGQLGVEELPEDRLIKHQFDVRIVKVACGRDNSAFLTDEGFLFTMGSNKHGKLGLNLSYEECKGVSQPVLVTELSSSPVTDVSLGKRHSLAACHNQTVYSWGKMFDDAGSCSIKPEMVFQGLTLEKLRVRCGP